MTGPSSAQQQQQSLGTHPGSLRPCSCGHRIQSSTTTTTTAEHDGVVATALSNMEASFVHLSSSSAEGFTFASTPDRQDGLLLTCQHVDRMIRAADGNQDAALCTDCLNRVTRAVQDDIQRIQAETMAYHRAVAEESVRYQSLQKTLASNVVASGEASQDLLACTRHSFLDEIALLKDAYQQHEEELYQLKAIQREQHIVSQQLEEMENSVAVEQNSLELEARAFDNDIAHVSYQIQRVHDEMDSLATVRLHSALFELAVDKRGLRYPLINDLRLAYRPKGDVQWAEINAAWSQVLKLLLLAGTSAGFRPKSWRIVPLASCAKLMYLESNRREVYTMGGKDGCRDHMASSLRALTALLDPFVKHLASLLPECSSGIPHDMSRNRIGPCDLSRIEDGDDSGWSHAIQCISLNLRWIQDRASDWEAIRLMNVLVVTP
jgi:beclin